MVEAEENWYEHYVTNDIEEGIYSKLNKIGNEMGEEQKKFHFDEEKKLGLSPNLSVEVIGNSENPDYILNLKSKSNGGCDRSSCRTRRLG